PAEPEHAIAGLRARLELEGLARHVQVEIRWPLRPSLLWCRWRRHVIDNNMQPSGERKRIRRKRAGSFHHGDLRESLIVAAYRAVEKHGHAELSLRPLAEQLGVSQPAVYRHFT